MTLEAAREFMERNQVALYFTAIIAAMVFAWAWPGSASIEPVINPALAFMLFVTFLQVPLVELGSAFRNIRFLVALAVANFIAVPVLVWILMQFLPGDPLLVLGVLFVLLTPCVDYVVTFSHLGRADAKSLLAATPLLLLAQMTLLPVYLGIMVGADAAAFVKPRPFLHAFVVLIAGPLVLAAAVQFAARFNKTPQQIASLLGALPVPATALVLFVVIAAVVPQLGPAIGSVQSALPVFISFAVLAPLVGWLVARLLALPGDQRRALAFSAATRNSLVILPLALAVPGAIPVLPAVIVTQTLVELISELIYIRLIPTLDRPAT